jgi:hypothetical protein
VLASAHFFALTLNPASHMRIHPRHTCVGHTLRKRLQETIWHPVFSVFTPDCLAPVDGRHTNPQLLAFAKRQRTDGCSVSADDRDLQRKHGVGRCAMYTSLAQERERKGDGEARERIMWCDERNRRESHARARHHGYWREQTQRFPDNAVEQR